MTENLIAAIQDWPVLIQGAIGSAIFWLVLLIGQNVAAFSSRKVRKHSKERQKLYLFNEILRHKANRDGSTTFEAGAFYASVLWFRASHYVIRALVWLTLGLLFSDIIGVFSFVGFVGCLYYLWLCHCYLLKIDYPQDGRQECSR